MEDFTNIGRTSRQSATACIIPNTVQERCTHRKADSTCKRNQVEISSCGCSVRRIRSRQKFGFRKIWPLFKTLPTEIPRLQGSHPNATRQAHPQTTRLLSESQSKRSWEFYSTSHRTFKVTPAMLSQSITSFMNPDNLNHGCKANYKSGERETDGTSLEGSCVSENLSGIWEQPDSEVLDTNHAQWEFLSSTLERELKIPVGDTSSRNRFPSCLISHRKRSEISETDDWKVDLLNQDQIECSVNAVVHGMDELAASENVDRHAFNLQGQQDMTSVVETLDQDLARANPDDTISSFSTDTNRLVTPHRWTARYRNLTLKAEVGLNFLSACQLRGAMDKAAVSLHRLASTLIKAKRGAMKNAHGSADDKNCMTAWMLHPFLADAIFATPAHFLYGVQACLNEAVFRHFKKQSYGVPSQLQYANSHLRQVSFLKEFYAFEYLSPEQLTNPESRHFYENFRLFCNKKLQSLQERVGWVGRWPGKLSEVFLEGMKRVWMVHKLAFAFEPSPILFHVRKQAQFDPNLMETLVDNDEAKASSDDQNSFYDIVQFVVLPGFSFQDGSIVQSKVYLQPKSGTPISKEHL